MLQSLSKTKMGVIRSVILNFLSVSTQEAINSCLSFSVPEVRSSNISRSSSWLSSMRLVHWITSLYVACKTRNLKDWGEVTYTGTYMEGSVVL